MAKIYGLQTSAKVAIVRSLRNTIKIGEQTFILEDLNPTLERFNAFWELMETVQRHGYLRAAMSVIGKSAVGAWWTLRRHSEYGNRAPKRHRRRLFDFYMGTTRNWDNIKDFYNFAYKLMIAVMYLRYFGQAAFEILRDEQGKPLGLDFLHGLVVPNVDDKGKFKTPAFVQYPTSDPSITVEFQKPTDLVYLVNPDWEGSPMGGTDIEALATYTLPLDLYLMTAARDYMKHRDRPEVVYQLAPDISAEGFDSFVKEMEARHAGASNLGRNPIAVQGEFDVKELRPLPDSLPYQESRQDARDEELAVAGVSGAKLGISDDLSNANLRELRREFHETSLVPLFTLVEISLYEQVHVREFGISGWEFRFNTPDFLNAVERATVHMRYRMMGASSANEIRYDLGKPARTDPGGDTFVEPMGATLDERGSPPEGREQEPDDPSQTGEPTDDDQDPPRGDGHDEQPEHDILSELRRWKRFVLRRMIAGKPVREFNTEFVPDGVANLVREYLAQVSTVDDAAAVFDTALDGIRGYYGDRED